MDGRPLSRRRVIATCRRRRRHPEAAPTGPNNSRYCNRRIALIRPSLSLTRRSASTVSARCRKKTRTTDRTSLAATVRRSWVPDVSWVGGLPAVNDLLPATRPASTTHLLRANDDLKTRLTYYFRRRTPIHSSVLCTGTHLLLITRRRRATISAVYCKTATYENENEFITTTLSSYNQSVTCFVGL